MVLLQLATVCEPLTPVVSCWRLCDHCHAQPTPVTQSVTAPLIRCLLCTHVCCTCSAHALHTSWYFYSIIYFIAGTSMPPGGLALLLTAASVGRGPGGRLLPAL